MILAFMILCVSIPANAACGMGYARYHGMDETLHAWLAAAFPPYGMFCAINLFMED